MDVTNLSEDSLIGQRGPTRRRLLHALGLLAAGVSVSAACGPSASPAVQPTSVPAQPTTAAAAQAAPGGLGNMQVSIEWWRVKPPANGTWTYQQFSDAATKLTLKGRPTCIS
jgi:hypothetical protein